MARHRYFIWTAQATAILQRTSLICLARLPSVNKESDTSSTEAKYYVYGYDSTDLTAAKAHSTTFNSTTFISYETFGVLYNWIAVMEGACSTGWHVPSAEKATLLDLQQPGSKQTAHFGRQIQARMTMAFPLCLVGSNG